MPDDFVGVTLDECPRPFQIVQQGSDGAAVVGFRGRWRHASSHARVEIRIVRETDQTPVCPWQAATLREGDRWEHLIEGIPAGGLYRTETRLVVPDLPPECGPHGQFVHHWGVGDLWVIAGQSNAAGYGRGPVHDPPRLGLHILKNNETWDIADHPLNDPTGSKHPNTEIANPGHSPYLSFARRLNDILGYPIGLIQTALGNTRLAEWNPVENPSAPLYHNLLHCIRLAGGRVRGLLWYQGESDTNPGLAETYEARFSDFVGRLRAELNAPDLPIVLAQSNRYTGQQSPEEHRGWSIIREAQRNARKLGNVAVVPTLDLPLSDDCHTSPEGNLLLGLRKADAALGLLHVRQSSCGFPDIHEAVAGTDHRTIDLGFDSVPSRLQFIAPGDADFLVEDRGEMIQIRRAEVVERNRVRLILSRPVTLNACVHSALGANPPANLRDVEQNVPVLAFYGLPVR